MATGGQRQEPPGWRADGVRWHEQRAVAGRRL